MEMCVCVMCVCVVYYRIKVWEAEQILNFTSEDYSSAMGKLEQVALRWTADYDPLAQSGLAGFEAYLTPYRFKLQIEKSFGVRLNGAEVVIIM